MRLIGHTERNKPFKRIAHSVYTKWTECLNTMFFADAETDRE